MPYEFYLVLHLIGIFLILLPLGGIALHIMNGGTRDFPNRRFMAIVHGVGLLIAFVAGFGLMARLGIMGGWPTWIYVKLFVWFALGLIPLAIYRKWGSAKLHFALIVLLAGLSAYMAVYKPSASTPESAEMEAFEAEEVEEITTEPGASPEASPAPESPTGAGAEAGSDGD